MVKSASGSQGLIFSEVFDGELWVIERPPLDVWGEDRLVIVTDENDLLNSGRLCESFEVVPNDGMSSDVEERLKKSQYNQAAINPVL